MKCVNIHTFFYPWTAAKHDFNCRSYCMGTISSLITTVTFQILNPAPHHHLHAALTFHNLLLSESKARPEEQHDIMQCGVALSTDRMQHFHASFLCVKSFLL
jgi:hypothetical protein